MKTQNEKNSSEVFKNAIDEIVRNFPGLVDTNKSINTDQLVEHLELLFADLKKSGRIQMWSSYRAV